MDDKERLACFRKTKEQLKETDLSKVSPEAKLVLGTLKLWFEGKCKDEVLVMVAFETWSRLLEEKAISMKKEAIDAKAQPGCL